jgi:peptide/nickel transport system ATP-binding protein
MADAAPLLALRNLSKCYALKGGFFDTARGKVQVVDRITFSVARGQCFGLVGESGSGKTTIARMIVRVVEPDSGEIAFWDEKRGPIDLCRLSDRQLRPLRRKIQMIFQDPYAALDPRMTVLRIVGEPLRATSNMDSQAVRQRVAEMLEMVGLRHEYMNRYPHAFSGGQRQRIGIARALATEPRLVVADEPVSALDVSVQAQILNLLCELRERLNLTFLFISHDLAVIRYMCDVVGVIYLGRLVEVADKTSLFRAPKHPYTEALLAAAPRPEPSQVNPGWEAPASTATLAGCPYRARCHYQKDICAREAPELRNIAPGRSVACHFDLSLSAVWGAKANQQFDLELNKEPHV